MNVVTRKLTTAAVCTALAVIMCVCTAYLPLSFMPLFLAAFCIFLACKRAGMAYGVLCAIASVGLMFLMTGLSVKWLAFILIFAPYGLITPFAHRFNYFKVKSGLLRALCALVFFNVTFGVVYAIAINVMTVGLDGLDILEWSAKLGGYAVLAAIASAILVPLDFVFSTMSMVVLKKIPAPVTKRPPPPASDNDSGDDPEKKYDDVFGYEIVDRSDKK